MGRSVARRTIENALRRLGLTAVAGVDEVGRGCLAGPVVAAAVVLDPRRHISGLADSKVVPVLERETLYATIVTAAKAWAVASVEPVEIDRLNILNATFLAMRRAIAALPVVPHHVRVDGNIVPPGLACSAEAIIGGDSSCRAIGAASIIAKVSRDALLAELDKAHPGYGWAKNAGYGTKAHLEAIRTLGVTEHHRRTFAGVKEWVRRAAGR